ncbi:MAG TPA: hypothetical protein VIK78_12555, partial [Ruminiclostridium sp.]
VPILYFRIELVVKFASYSILKCFTISEFSSSFTYFITVYFSKSISNRHTYYIYHLESFKALLPLLFKVFAVCLSQAA